MLLHVFRDEIKYIIIVFFINIYPKLVVESVGFPDEFLTSLHHPSRDERPEYLIF